MTDTTSAAEREPRLELIHVHYTETGLSATHAELTALGGWIQEEVDAYNAAAEPAPGEIDAIENPLHHLLEDDRTQMVRPSGRMELIELLYAMSNEGSRPTGADDTKTDRLRWLARELAATLRCLHRVREDDYVLFVIE